jgi:thiol-disulfide isomerase/thioredoxin
MLSRRIAILLLLTTFSTASVVDDVRSAIAENNFTGAKAQLEKYRAMRGITPEYAVALSWAGRGALAANQLNVAESYAHQAEAAVKQQIAHRTLDSEPQLAIALGAAFEVQSRVLAAHGQQAEAAALLRQALATYGKTSIHARLQKNLNLLGLTGQNAPPLAWGQFLGPKPVALAQLKGSPVVLFFWAHWCGDCKAEGPILTRLRSEFAAKGLAVVAPTQLYGYAAAGEDASPKTEVAYIGQIWQKFYSGLQDVAVPISNTNFDAYGASTTPTLVLLNRAGVVTLYHPGALPYDQLRAEIEKIVVR